MMKIKIDNHDEYEILPDGTLHDPGAPLLDAKEYTEVGIYPNLDYWEAFHHLGAVEDIKIDEKLDDILSDVEMIANTRKKADRALYVKEMKKDLDLLKEDFTNGIKALKDAIEELKEQGNKEITIPVEIISN